MGGRIIWKIIAQSQSPQSPCPDMIRAANCVPTLPVGSIFLNTENTG